MRDVGAGEQECVGGWELLTRVTLNILLAKAVVFGEVSRRR